MRVGIVVPDLRQGGGVAEKALFVARALRENLGARVRMVSLATSHADDASLLLCRPRTWAGPASSTYSFEEFAVRHIGARAAEIELARYFPRRALAGSLRGCDVVHVVAGIPAWGWAVHPVRCPVILHFASFAAIERSSIAIGRRSPLQAWRRTMTRGVSVIEKAALRRADIIITVNETRRREVEAVVGPGRRTSTVHTGVDTTWFTPGPSCGPGYLLSVGRLDDARKNLPLLLRAYAAARAREIGIPRLVLAGHNPPTAEAWQLVARLGLDSVVQYVGPLTRGQLAATYRGATAFLLSSDEEGQGIVVLEAMASGVPVIATSCIGPAELITDGREGFLVPVRSVEGLARAILRLSVDRELRERMSHAARVRAVQEFSIERAGARLCDVYRDAGLPLKASA